MAARLLAAAVAAMAWATTVSAQDWSNAAICEIAPPEGSDAAPSTLTFAFAPGAGLVWRGDETSPGRQATLLNYDRAFVISFVDGAGNSTFVTIFGPGEQRFLDGAAALVSRHVINREGETVNVGIVNQFGRCTQRGRGLG